MNKAYRPAVVIAVVAAVIYSAGWYYFSKKFEVHVEQQLAAVQAKGFDVSFEKLTVGGYPFGYDITVSNLRVERGKIFQTWIDGDITFSAKLWKPQEISSLAAGMHHLEFDNVKVMGDGFSLKSFAFDPLRFQFYYDDLEVLLSDMPLFSAQNFEYDIDFTPEGSDKSTAEIALRAKNLTSPLLNENPLGDTIQNIIIRTELQGNFEGNNSFERLTSWYNSDGAADIQQLALQWDELKIQGEGTLSVDNKLQPIAAFSVSVEGLDKTVDAFVEKGYLKANIGDLIKTGVNFFNVGAGKKLSFSIQERKIILGSIPVAELPKIKWPENEGQ